MSDFDLRGVATIKEVKPRKEGPTDSRYTVLDVKVATQTNGENLERVMGVPWETLRDSFWATDGEFNPRFWTLSEIKLGDRELSDITVVFGGDSGFMVRGCDVRKITFLPRPHRLVDLTCVVGIPEPSDLAYTICGDNVGEEVEIKLQSAQQDLGLEDAG